MAHPALPADLVRELLRLGPTGALALLVWWEVHQLRAEMVTYLRPVSEGMAVVLSRCEVTAVRPNRVKTAEKNSNDAPDRFVE